MVEIIKGFYTDNGGINVENMWYCWLLVGIIDLLT